MQIRDVETLVGITKKNIRFYEKEGLLQPERNSDNSYREYSEADIEWLRMIKLLRKLAVPLQEIRLLRAGGRSFSELMERQDRQLEQEQRSCEYRRQLCSELQQFPDCPDPSAVNAYLLRIENSEREGVPFVDVQKQDTMKKYLGATVAGLAFCALLVLCLVMFIVDYLSESTADGPFWIFVLVLGVLVLTVFIALIQRYREIKEGEEDVASKY